MTMVLENTTRFEGIYEAKETSRFIATTLQNQTPLHISSRKVIYWIRRGLADRHLIIIPGRELFLTFEDVISMRIIAALRAAGVKFPKIYEAEKWLRKVTGHPKPFATEMLWTEKSEIFVEMKRKLIAASKSGQYAFEILEEYLIPVHGITFNEQHVARTWEPLAEILLDPQIQFGAPCIKDTRIPTRALWGMVAGGDTIEYVAESYHLTAKQVQNAIDWEDALIKN